jgi:hypothetical protein
VNGEPADCDPIVGISLGTTEEEILAKLGSPVHEDRLLSDQNFLRSVAALRKNGVPENGVSVFEPKGAEFNRDVGDRSIDGSQYAHPGAEGAGSLVEGGLLLAARLAAIESAVAVGAMTKRDAATRCAALRAEHDRRTSKPFDDETSILANAERLRAALISAATDALRDALRRTVGTVRCQPTIEGSSRYLMAQFVGGDAALLEWLAIGEAANQPGLSALVAGACFSLA